MVLKQSNPNAKRKTITDNINLRTKISMVGGTRRTTPDVNPPSTNVSLYSIDKMIPIGQRKSLTKCGPKQMIRNKLMDVIWTFFSQWKETILDRDFKTPFKNNNFENQS